VEKKLHFLSIGHCCHDKVGEDYILGGTASYASLVAQQLNYQSSIITSVGPHFLFGQEFVEADIELRIIPAEQTTVFENIYLPKGRTQYLHHRAADISKDKLNSHQIFTDILLLCPIANEVNIDVLDLITCSLTGASIQGWLRSWGANKQIIPSKMNWSMLSELDIVIISQEDIGYSEHVLKEITNVVSHVVLTDGVNGASVFMQNKEFKFPSFSVDEVEATGAGDVFTTAYLHQFLQTADVEKSCIFAHCAASFIVEGIGIRNLPTIERISERVREYGLT